MCGIFAVINPPFPASYYEDAFMNGKSRGPEHSTLKTLLPEENCILGFHRLAINGLDENSNQPLLSKTEMGDIELICNGEIYNHRNIYETLLFASSSSSSSSDDSFKPTTNSDCEVIIHAYLKWGIRATLQLLDGVFAFILVDKKEKKIFAARDPYGVRPLYYYKGSSSDESTTQPQEQNMIFASTIKSIVPLLVEGENAIHHFPPGHFMEINQSESSSSIFLCEAYSEPGWSNFLSNMFHPRSECMNFQAILKGIREKLTFAVRKRVMNTDRPIACLLSGGLDSSLICALVCQELKTLREANGHEVETYSIGFKGSDDLKYARKVAEYLGTKHTEVVATEEEFLRAIPEVIHAIESFDTTTVRASVGNYLVAKYIAKHSLAKVIFNGDGSDELCGGYLYMSRAPDYIVFDAECRRLLRDIHIFDVLRSDRSISSNGLEARTPFLDREFTQFYLTIPASIRFHVANGRMEKYLLRLAFDSDSLLPTEVLWRKKEAFSDGVSASHQRSWYQVIHEHLASMNDDDDTSISTAMAAAATANETLYYKEIFNKFYAGCEHLIPYLWMPRFIANATDPSARTL